MDLLKSRIVRAIFWGREVVLGSKPEDNALPRSLLAQVKTLGWGVLAEVFGREIVIGAVTQPWEADVVFHALRPDEFVTFGKPGYVKIAWTLCAEPIDSGGSLFRTETRALATDAQARSKFRLYWSFVSPGVKLIRRLSLATVKAEAERSAREAPLIASWLRNKRYATHSLQSSGAYRVNQEPLATMHRDLTHTHVPGTGPSHAR